MIFDSFRPTIGLEFGHKTVRAARAKQGGGALTLLEHAEKPQDGLLLQPLLDALRISPKKVVILVPANQVYTSLFTFPATAKKDLQKHLHDEIARTIPEDPSTLTVRSKVLQQSKEGIHVGIAAARTDIIHNYTNACLAAHLRPIGMTTAPCVIANALPQHPSSFVLVHATQECTTATLFYQSWPIDEEVFPEGTTMEIVMQAARKMMEEYQVSGITTDKIFVCGVQTKKESGPTARGKIKPRTKSSPEVSSEQSLPEAEEVFPAWKGGTEWIAPAHASCMRISDISVNFIA